MNDKILCDLKGFADEKYRVFQQKLMPNIAIERILGVRTPVLRKYAKTLSEEERECFLAALPHEYTDENNLHGFLIEGIKDFDRCVKEIDRFLPYVDNWATCDLMSPKIFKKHKEELLIHIKRWLKSSRVYTVRFGIEMLMSHYLDEDFKVCYLDWVAAIKSDEYYVKMMVAWYFATALAKQYDATIPYIEQKKLAVWTHNKAIQKSVESYRITDEQKEYLKGLKVK